MKTQIIEFSADKKATVLRVADSTFTGMLTEITVATLSIPRPRAILVLNGGTATLEEPLQTRLARIFQAGLARVVAEEQITVITGGTDAGIFQLFGQGLARYGRTAPCIGVTVADLVAWPGHPQGEAPLEPHHSHFVLVAGKEWGDETQTMYAVVDSLAQSCPSLTIFAGGGEITLHEMQMNVAQARPMLLLAGSGRATDAVLAVHNGAPAAEVRIQQIAEKGKIFVCDITEPPATLAALVRRLLALDGGGQ